MTTHAVSADTTSLRHFVDRGRSYQEHLQSLYANLAQRRSVVEGAVSHQVEPQAPRLMAELLVEAASHTLFVELVHDALVAWSASTPAGPAPPGVIDRSLVAAGFTPSGVDLTLARDIEGLEAALGEALAAGDLLGARRVRELRAIAIEANGGLTADQQSRFDALVADRVAAYPAWLLTTRTPEEVVEQLRADVYAEAGIDADRWVPALGVPHNTDTIEAVYRYYPRLYEVDPDMLWVALASIAAPQFYAGFADISDLRRVASAGGDVIEAMESASLPAPLVAALAGLTAEEAAEALSLMEVTFLDMQRQIFDDMAVQHYAYQVGGLDLIEAFAHGTAGGQDPPLNYIESTIEPWRLFESGRLEESTNALVDREQRRIIQDDYDDIWDHSAASKLFVTAAGYTAADPSGGPSFFEHVITPRVRHEWDLPDFDGLVVGDVPARETPPIRIDGPGDWDLRWDPPDLPGLRVPDLPPVVTPELRVEFEGWDLSANVANEEDRMRWIVDVVNPGVIGRWQHDPDGLTAQVHRDLAAEVERYRQVPSVARP